MVNRDFQYAVKTAQTAIKEAAQRHGPIRGVDFSNPRMPFHLSDIKSKTEMVLVVNPSAPGGVMPMTRKQAERTGLPILPFK